MTVVKGYIFQTLVAILPPATVLSIYLYSPATIQNTSVTVAVLLGLAYAWVIAKDVYPFFTNPLRHLPSPPREGFIWGHGSHVFKRPPGSGLLQTALETPNDGIIMFRSLGHIRTSLLLTQPHALMEVMNTHAYDWQKPKKARQFLARILGEGLVNVEGQEHKMQRKAVAPAFSGRNMRDLVPLFWQKGQDFVDRVGFEIESTAGHLEMMRIVSRVTLDIIGAAGIGKDFNTLEDKSMELAQLYATITDTEKGSMILYFFINMMFPPWVVRILPWKFSRQVARATHRLRAIVKELLDEKKRAMALKDSHQKDIISTIMRSGDFSDDYLTDQLLTFLAAGHDTTASSLTWTSYMLAIHPEMQDRLREECTKHLAGMTPDSVDADVVDRLPYLNAVCNETLRFYPTVPATARESIRATKIGDMAVPKGTFAIMSPWLVNRLPSLWGADAGEYKPQRWIDEEAGNGGAGVANSHGGAKSPQAFITFLHGPRSCIGQTFARLEMKCLLAQLVMNYRWTKKDMDEEVVPEGVVTIKPKYGMHLIFSKIQ